MRYAVKIRNTGMVFLLLTFIFLLSCKNGAPSNELLSRYIGANHLYDIGKLELASDEFKAIADTDQRFYQARFMQGKCLFFMGKSHEAQLIFEQLSTNIPEYFDASYWNILSLDSLGKNKDQEGKLTRLISYNAQDFRLLYQLGRVRQMQGNTADAIEYYKKGLLAEEEFGKVHFALAKIYYQQGVIDKAKEEIDRTLAVLSSESAVYAAAKEIKSKIDEINQ